MKERRDTRTGSGSKNQVQRRPRQGFLAGARCFAFRLVLFGVVWWGLAGGSLQDWPLGLFFVLAAAVSSMFLVPGQNLRLPGLPGFIPFFLHLSLLGGLDVTSRAFRPSMPLKTGIIMHRVQLEHPTARVLFVWVVSLLPGTASVQLVDQSLRIHVLDAAQPHQDRLKDLEKRIQALFRT
ncbi:Na+/H+ antiporter subunit E [Desulfonatronospira sp. MSAO_Bac3]|uniref:Na+/H+ antiporter subunit E n=1 Tax=Desulfonatronospira sp. MSAO_Bac3 TaxID=2293857 RepID=UPI000FF140D1|nr:Na+/H+ antiporter subunit E [Desulfonatronospira sp. MSAO_Bac3]RQD73168.1 MAG: cation transporter [Desulfonatronospira sp. MSAO_Bac3]